MNVRAGGIGLVSRRREVYRPTAVCRAPRPSGSGRGYRLSNSQSSRQPLIVYTTTTTTTATTTAAAVTVTVENESTLSTASYSFYTRHSRSFGRSDGRGGEEKKGREKEEEAAPDWMPPPPQRAHTHEQTRTPHHSKAQLELLCETTGEQHRHSSSTRCASEWPLFC